MRYCLVLFATLAFAACSSPPTSSNGSQAASQAQAPNPVQAQAPGPQKASLDSIVQFLIASAATDFNTHRPPDPVRFREVRVGHLTNPSGEERYMLCGQFLPAKGGDTAEWVPFATIKTSGYEQWIGAQAVGYCQNSSVVWDNVGDLSSTLQSRFDSLQ